MLAIKHPFAWYSNNCTVKSHSGGFTLTGCLVLTKATLSLPSTDGQEGEKKKNLMSWDKGRKRSLTNDHNGQNWGKIILIYWQSSQSKIMRNKTQSYTIFPSPLPYSDFSPGFSTSSQRCCRGNGDAGIWLLSVHHVLSLRLLPPQQRAPHTPPLLQSGVPPIGDCELHKLLPLESFP